MWNGLVTDELNELFQQYAEQHNGIEPDEYLSPFCPIFNLYSVQNNK